MAMKVADAVVSGESLWAEVQSFRSSSRGESQQEIAEAFAALTVTWFAWEVAISERQAVEILRFLAERSPGAIPELKAAFVAWFESLWR
jgi:head-tail adaptor